MKNKNTFTTVRLGSSMTDGQFSPLSIVAERLNHVSINIPIHLEEWDEIESHNKCYLDGEIQFHMKSGKPPKIMPIDNGKIGFDMVSSIIKYFKNISNFVYVENKLNRCFVNIDNIESTEVKELNDNDIVALSDVPEYSLYGDSQIFKISFDYGNKSVDLFGTSKTMMEIEEKIDNIYDDDN